MKSTISYGYPYASAGIETALPVIENKSTPSATLVKTKVCDINLDVEMETGSDAKLAELKAADPKELLLGTVL